MGLDWDVSCCVRACVYVCVCMCVRMCMLMVWYSYMFTVANAREITEQEVEEALNALYAAYGAGPVF